MIKKLVLIALIAITQINPAQAARGGSFQTGNDLFAACDSTDSEDRLLCAVWVVAFTEGFAIAQAPHPVICFPSGATIGQDMDIIVRYLRSHPEQRHLRAGVLAGAALGIAFPCRNSN